MRGKLSENRGTRRAGFTVLEVTVTVAIVFLVMGVLAAVYPALTSASVETTLFLNAQIENDKARLALIEDLQTTDSIRLDPTGVPYFQIVDRSPGTQNALILRCAEGYDADATADMVTTGFGTPIRYFVNDQGQLIRRQDGADRVIAQNVQGLRFSKSIEGTVFLEITTRYVKNGQEETVESHLQIIPRNVLKI